MDVDQIFEPTLAGAARSHKWVVVVGALLGIALSVVAGMTIFDNWSASAAVLVEDPRGASVFEQGRSLDPRRFVGDQVAILESPEIARRAADSVGEPVSELTTRELLRLRTVSSNPESGLIEISVRFDSEETAIDLANAFIAEYQRVAVERAEAATRRAVSELESSIDAVERQLEALELEIAGLFVPDTVVDELLAQVLGSEGSSAEELQRLVARLQAFQLSQQIRGQSSEVASLIAQRGQLLERRTQLELRRDQLGVDAALATSGVIHVSNAEYAEATPGTARLAAIGLLLGLILGVAGAYLRSLRTQRFENRREPEAILGAPLLAEVPDFEAEAITSEFPMRDRPLSAAAEAYRFAGSAVSDRAPSGTSEIGDFVGGVVIAVTSALMGDGKSVTTGNVGAALATKGKRVLVIDADFGEQSLTRLILPKNLPVRHPGLTDMAELDVALTDAVRTVDLHNGLQLDVLSRGTQAIAAPEFFRRRIVNSLFAQIRAAYDLILVDVPPMLQVAYAASVVRLCDQVLMVVRHGRETGPVVEAADRVALTGRPITGYVYNRAPLRPGALSRHGSMRDPLGLGVTAEEQR